MGELKILGLNNKRDRTLLTEIMGEKDFDRFQRIQNPDISDAEKAMETWRMISNQIIRLRRKARNELEVIRELRLKQASLDGRLEVEKNKYEIEHLESQVLALDEIIKSTFKVLAAIGKLVVINLEWYDTVATDHDFAQLINANIQEVTKCRIEYEKNKEREHCFFVNLIFVQNIEPEPEQPLFEAIAQMFRQELVENWELRERAKNKAEELFPELKYIPRYESMRMTKVIR